MHPRSHPWYHPVGFVAVIADVRTYTRLAYLLLSFPLGIAYFVGLAVGLSLGIGLLVIVVGLPILLGVVVASRYLAAFERALANALLDVDIEAPTDVSVASADSLWAVIGSILGAASTWLGLVFLFLKFWLGTFAFVAVVVLGSISAALVTAPLHYDTDAVVISDTWTIDSPEAAILAVPIGLLVGIASLHLLGGLAWLYGRIADALLGNPRAGERA